MWDYHDIPRKRAALEKLSQAERDALTWDNPGHFLRFDTLALAAWSGMKERKEGTPFDAICIANGFPDLIRK